MTDRVLEFEFVDELRMLWSESVSEEDTAAQCVAVVLLGHRGAIGIEPIFGYDDSDAMCRGFSIYEFEDTFAEPVEWVEQKLRREGVRMNSWIWTKVSVPLGTPVRVAFAEGADSKGLVISLSPVALLIHLPTAS